MSECRDQMDPTYNFVGVEKSNGTVVILTKKPETMEPSLLPACLEFHITAKPPHPEEVDPLNFSRLRLRAYVTDLAVKDTNYPTIPVWMRIGGILVFM